MHHNHCLELRMDLPIKIPVVSTGMLFLLHSHNYDSYSSYDIILIINKIISQVGMSPP